MQIINDIIDLNFFTSFAHRAQLQTTVPLNFDLRTSGTISYSLIVSVNDTEHVDYVEVNVMVLDINDNDPMFDNDTYRLVTNNGDTTNRN